jgi:hypothetical protein
MQSKTDLTPFIITIQGTDFIKFPGLMQEAHALGLSSIVTELLTPVTDLTCPVVKATVTLFTSSGTVKSFTGYGDANEKNVASKVRGALLRMAETRAIARALRFACNISMTAFEEIDLEENVISSTKPAKVTNIEPNFNTATTTAPTVKATNFKSAPIVIKPNFVKNTGTVKQETEEENKPVNVNSLKKDVNF